MGNAPSSSRSSTPPPPPAPRAVAHPRPPQPQRQASVIVPPRAHSPTHRGSLVLSRGPSAIPPVLSVGSPVLDDEPPRTPTPVVPPSPKENGLARLQDEVKRSEGEEEEEEDDGGDEDKRRPEYSRYKTASDVLPVQAPVPRGGYNSTYTTTPFSTEPEQDVGESASGDLRDASEEGGVPESKPEGDKDRDGLRVTDWASAAAAMEQAMEKVKERAVAFAKEGVDRRAKAREEEERLEAARLEQAEGAKRTVDREVVGDKAAGHAGEKLEKIEEAKEDADENMENTENAQEKEEEEAEAMKDATKEEKAEKAEEKVNPVEEGQEVTIAAKEEEKEDADNIYPEGKPDMKSEADEDNAPKGEATADPHSDDDAHSDDEPHFPPGLTPNDRDTNEDDSASALPGTLLMPSIYTGMFSRSRTSLQAQRRASDADDLGYGTQEGEDSESEAGEMVKKADGEEAIRVVEASDESLPAEVQDVDVDVPQVEEVPMPGGPQLQQPLFVASSTEEFEPRVVYNLPSPVAEVPKQTRAFVLEEDPVVEAVPVPQEEDPFRDPVQTPISTPWPPAGSSPRVLDPTVYILSDKRWGSTFDLSGGDNRSAIAFGHHGWENQQWEFSKLGAGFAIRSMRNGSYLSIVDFGALAREGGAPVVTTSFPACWDVEAQSVDSGFEEEDVDALIRIRWPESNLFLGLSDAVAGTKICLSSDTSASNVWYARVHPRPQVTYGPPTTTENTIRHVNAHRGVSTMTTTTTFTTTTTKTITRITTSGI